MIRFYSKLNIFVLCLLIQQTNAQEVTDNLTVAIQNTSHVNSTDNLTITSYANSTDNLTVAIQNTSHVNSTHNLTITSYANYTHNLTVAIQNTSHVNSTDNLTITSYANYTHNLTVAIQNTSHVNSTDNLTIGIQNMSITSEQAKQILQTYNSNNVSSSTDKLPISATPEGLWGEGNNTETQDFSILGLGFRDSIIALSATGLLLSNIIVIGVVLAMKPKKTHDSEKAKVQSGGYCMVCQGELPV